jgi:phosphonate transport system ATP-binding protein
MALALRQQAEAPAAELLPDIQASGISKRFGNVDVLTDVGFSVARGEAVALIGANGAGKSTLLRCCVRLVEPDSGRIRMLGEDVRGLGAAALRRLRSRVGFVFQRHNLVPRVSVLSNVLHGSLARDGGVRSWFHQIAPQARREAAMECLDRVGLAHLAARRADRLSGGQSQRVAVARALMQNARMIFADEPVASLDPSAGEDVMGLFRDLSRRDGLTLVFTTHNVRHALDFSDRVVGLRNGRIAIDARSGALTPASLRAFYE